ncbi:hypothetical protein BHM03_00011470 [Ensete ventricosum]|uniref:DUF547 domain-containing protein n=1 Tax=Ensete ventricosum TaxID=4639 RepID=A0A427AB02_ENSVE|nr:hypothetical protein B296_00033377 [Ensete ventricosum]RZR84616.1 hypothetical protein BHM03_00011470 [Ensete ventricosum]
MGTTFDPYRAHGKLCWADIGNYSLATEVSWMSVEKKQLEYAAGALRRFRIREVNFVALFLALHKLKLSEEQKKFSIETLEPLVAFALSCGSYSSPAVMLLLQYTLAFNCVKIYSPANVKEELQEAQRDYVRASVGVSSKGKLLVPKMLYCFARGVVDDANLAIWISQFLPQQQAAFVQQCMSQRRQRFLGSCNFRVMAFDSRFRYLFLPEKLT